MVQKYKKKNFITNFNVALQFEVTLLKLFYFLFLIIYTKSYNERKKL